MVMIEGASELVMKEQLPMLIQNADQFWGSLLRLNGKAADDRPVDLCVLYCSWTLNIDGITRANSDGLSADNSAGLSLLEGRVLSRIDIDSARHRFLLVFDHALQISIAASLGAYEEDDDLFTFNLPDIILAYNPKQGWVSEARSDVPRLE